VRLYSRNAYDWTARHAAIAGAVEQITPKSFTIDGEAVVLRPDSLSRFEELLQHYAAGGEAMAFSQERAPTAYSNTLGNASSDAKCRDMCPHMKLPTTTPTKLPRG
jgi:hypothetical protein